MKGYITLAAVLPLLGLVRGHGVITAVTGANGVTTMGFGVASNIPRNGTSEQPFQLDTPVLKNLVDDPCGATLQGGSIDIASSLVTATTQGGGDLPTLSTNGSITMTVHQINADGGGPFTAMVNLDATGATWEAIAVTQQVPGANGLLRGGPVDSQFTAQVTDPSACTGGSTGDVCLVRINNGGALSLADGAGPFGGCVAVRNAAATGSATTSAAASTATTATTATNAKTAAEKSSKKNKNRSLGSLELRDLFPSLARRHEEFSALQAKREALDAEIELKRREILERQLLTVDLIDELKTATGTAIDIPIDAFAGHVDADANGGNSSTAANPILTTQQAVDLKKAVQLAIENAISVMASSTNITIDAPGFSSANQLTAAQIDEANQAAALALVDGETTSINQGNAGVGEPNTSLLNSLLGSASDLATVTVSSLTGAFTGTVTPLVAAAVTDAAAATATVSTTVANAAATDAATTTKKGKTNKNKKNRRDSFAKRNMLSRMAYAES